MITSARHAINVLPLLSFLKSIHSFSSRPHVLITPGFSLSSSSRRPLSSSAAGMGSLSDPFPPLPYPPARRDDSVVYNYHGALVPDPYNCDLDSEAEVLLDPNALSEDGTVALSTAAISRDGRYLAYGLSSSGSDWVTIKVMRIDDKKTESDTISWKLYWLMVDNREGGDVDAGTETDINLNHQLCYHFLGTDQLEDILCWKDPENPEHIFNAIVTEDGKIYKILERKQYVTLTITEGCDPVNKLYYCDLSTLSGGLADFKGGQDILPFIKLVDNFEAQYEVVANDDTEFTFLTNKEAPRYKLVRVNLSKPEIWTDVLVEDQRDVLESVYAVNGDQLLVCYLSDVKHILQIRDLQTGLFLHDLPIEMGTVTGISGKRKDAEIFIGFTSFLTPGVIYKCNLSSEAPEMKVFRDVSVADFDKDDFQVKQVFFSSKDGTKIPMFIVSRKDITLDGSHPTLLYGYGGFNISLTPSFSVGRIVLARNLRFVVCIANIRGGGEYGEEWHKAGSLSRKQNCFDDFIAASEFLISSGYTNSRKLCIEGGSNGGLLVAACINQRPDLFGCALAHVGVMDMLRFHKFTIGHAWTSDYGCSDTEDEFQWLIKYSPLHNVKRPWDKSSDSSTQYPPTMLLTADHDDRVVPLHSLKLLAVTRWRWGKLVFLQITIHKSFCVTCKPFRNVLERKRSLNGIVDFVKLGENHSHEFFSVCIDFTNLSKACPKMLTSNSPLLHVKLVQNEHGGLKLVERSHWVRKWQGNGVDRRSSGRREIARSNIAKAAATLLFEESSMTLDLILMNKLFQTKPQIIDEAADRADGALCKEYFVQPQAYLESQTNSIPTDDQSPTRKSSIKISIDSVPINHGVQPPIESATTIFVRAKIKEVCVVDDM
ncbi:hypothetical protein KSP40_PGU014811 [Platanthera guangdongensis]|uniref:Prolyl endopeptidase n=1 Tax=Platanthera guangdongensis TaxID=2320717 RepID=A0ABR2LSD9_9ASPA